MKKSLGILRNRTLLLDELRKESRKNRMISSMPQGSRSINLYVDSADSD